MLTKIIEFEKINNKRKKRIFISVHDPIYDVYANLMGIKKEIKGCLAGHDRFAILSNGDVVFCPLLPIKIGNVKEESLINIFSTANKILAELRNSNNLKGHCKTCLFNDLCRGCRAYSFHVLGDIFAGDPMCFLSKNLWNNKKL